MGMDIYFLSEKTKLISTIDSLEPIKKELIEFEKRTGVLIDEYGKTNLYLAHIKLLDKLIDKPNEWKVIFEKAINLNSGLLIEGD